MVDISSLAKLQAGVSRRVSSYDRTGGNKDYATIAAGRTSEVCRIDGPGEVRHIWMTMASSAHPAEELLPRKVVLRMYWDGEPLPSVEAPIGDFFGMGHGVTRNYTSACLTMSPEDGRAFNCFFPMPFASGARLEVVNQADSAVKLYYYMDYVEKPVDESLLRYHAQWRRERPASADPTMPNEEFEFGGNNTTGSENYVILDAEGEGHYVGCNFNVHNLRFTHEWNWYGEGDDMIFIDGEPWPPSMHGTGTEDYFNTAWCPQQEVQTPYHGIIMGGGPNWSGKISVYRYHLADPVIFRRSIRVTIEHGHNNHRSDDLSSTAYWYQREPHRPFPELAAVADRLPLPDTLPMDAGRLKGIFG